MKLKTNSHEGTLQNLFNTNMLKWFSIPSLCIVLDRDKICYYFKWERRGLVENYSHLLLKRAKTFCFWTVLWVRRTQMNYWTILPFPHPNLWIQVQFYKRQHVGDKMRQTTFLYSDFFFLFSWLREHLSSPYRPSSHLMLTKDIEGDTQTHTRDVPHQKCAEECACCLSALDTSSRGFVKCLFSFAIHFVLCTTGKEMQLMLQRKLIQFPTFTQTNLKKDPFWNLDAEKSQ